VYLYNKDYPKCETAAREAIILAEADGYKLIDDFESIFDINNEGNPEYPLCRFGCAALANG
jgi:hypothetical protein